MATEYQTVLAAIDQLQAQQHARLKALGTRAGQPMAVPAAERPAAEESKPKPASVMADLPVEPNKPALVRTIASFTPG